MREGEMADAGSMGHVHVAIVGSGFGGLGMAIRLKERGINDFAVLERADDVGGVWRDNRYPGCACDVQSHLYSFSFAPNPAWTRRFSPQPEIWAYLVRCADEFGIRPHIRFRTDVERAEWDASAARWTLATSRGVMTADVLVAAPGALSEPRLPQVPGLETFAGEVFHSARWDPSAMLAGRRVAVVGTGASAIQIVPAIQPVVSRLVLFQRTPPWVLPRHDAPLSVRTRRWMDRVPPLRRAVRGSLYGFRELFGLPFRHPRLAALPERMARRHLREQVPDAALRRILTPSYAIGCKRILLSDDYYPALSQPNVQVVPTGLAEVRGDAVVGPDGVPHAVDAIIFATGFHVTDFPFAARIRGAGGRLLSDVWGASPKAHLGTTVAGFPNLFVLSGPNTGLGHTSVLLMIEAQVDHVLNALDHMQRNGIAAVAPTVDAQAAWITEVDRKMEGTVWTSGGCKSWYLDETGRNSTLWPGSVGSFVRRVTPFRSEEYHLYPGPPSHASRAAAARG
ncbi:MAG TPA: NAD(P)/FAD-dependent oxidoreductase [Longimicrobiaceae bacterium]|nr:NAD(P)/FAD-dependent oxidoreductase [Longimicrobiaceae bacterium]